MSTSQKSGGGRSLGRVPSQVSSNKGTIGVSSAGSTKGSVQSINSYSPPHQFGSSALQPLARYVDLWMLGE
jgi:hypothetical protein